MTKAMPYDEAVNAYGPTTKLKRAYTFKALNRLIQASAADMTKQAMVNICETGKIPCSRYMMNWRFLWQIRKKPASLRR